VAALQSNEFIAKCPKSLQIGLVSCAEWVECAPYQVLFRQNDTGDSFYSLFRGVVTITVRGDKGNGDIVFEKEFEKGYSFGELSLVLGKPRAATVTVGATGCDLLKISKMDYDRLLRSDDLQSIKALRDFLITVPSLQSLSVDTIDSLLPYCKLNRYPRGQVLFKQDEVAEKVFIIRSGRLKLVNKLTVQERFDSAKITTRYDIADAIMESSASTQTKWKSVKKRMRSREIHVGSLVSRNVSCPTIPLSIAGTADAANKQSQVLHGETLTVAADAEVVEISMEDYLKYMPREAQEQIQDTQYRRRIYSTPSEKRSPSDLKYVQLEILKNSFFAELDTSYPGTVASLSEVLQLRSLINGDAIVRSGTPSDWMHVILKGGAVIEREEHALQATIERAFEGEILGELAVSKEKTYDFSAYALYDGTEVRTVYAQYRI